MGFPNYAQAVELFGITIQYSLILLTHSGLAAPVIIYERQA